MTATRKNPIQQWLMICICLITFPCGSISAQRVNHVVLISIDGLRPEFYLDESWATPNLRQLMSNGVYADAAQSVFPSVTYPSHTAIVTGANPATHGVYFNGIRDSKNGAWYWEERFIKTKTLWDAVKEAGMTSAAVMWPVTVGAPIDHNFPVRRANSDEKGDQLTITRRYVTPETFVDDFEKINGKLDQTDFSYTNDQLDKTIGKMANFIIKTQRPNLMAIHFIGADHMQHAHGTSAPEVKRAVAVIDSLVGTVRKALSDAGIMPNTAIIITGDHGHQDTKVTFAPNIYLARHHLLNDDRHWRAKFYPAGGSAFLYLKDDNDQEALMAVKKLLAGLPENQKDLFRIAGRKELDDIGADPEAALALVMKPGATVSGSLKGEPLRKKTGGSTHGYYPEFPEMHTGFIAAGAGIASGQRIALLKLVDIVPLVSQLLGLEMEAPDGKLVPGILQRKP